MTKTAIADQFAILNHCLSSWYLLSSYNMFALSYTMSSLCLFHAGLLFPINSPRDKQIFANTKIDTATYDGIIAAVDGNKKLRGSIIATVVYASSRKNISGHANTYT